MTHETTTNDKHIMTQEQAKYAALAIVGTCVLAGFVLGRKSVKVRTETIVEFIENHPKKLEHIGNSLFRITMSDGKTWFTDTPIDMAQSVA